MSKAIPYTLEESNRVALEYDNGETIEAIALLMGRKTRSIIGKLVELGVYINTVKLIKVKPLRKVDYINQLKSICNLNDADTTSLEAVNNSALLSILDALQTNPEYRLTPNTD